MARSISSPLISKIHSSTRKAGLKKHSKNRSSVASELFRKNARPFTREAGKNPRVSWDKGARSPSYSRVQSSARSIPSQFLPARQSRKHRAGTGDQGRELGVVSKVSHDLNRYTVDDKDEDSSGGSMSSGDESDEDEEDWVDGSTLIAPYQDEDSETEEDRTLALVEYLQVPMQEKSRAIKQELCDLLIDTITEIRKTHQKLERGADVDRGKGIITFNDACDKRHIDASRARAEFKEKMIENQAEIKNLFVELKQAYARRDQLWVDLRLRIEEITKLQASVLDQLDDNMERTIAALEKKGKALLKGDTVKDKEKLLRGVLGKL